MDKWLIEKTVVSKRLYEGKIVNLREDVVESNKGRFSREIIEHPGAVTIIPVIKEADTIIMVRQFRQAVKKTLLELPAGTLKRGERPEDCAKRELLEETGYTAGSLKKILRFYPAPGYDTEVIHLYLATDLTKSMQRLEEDENIVVLEVKKEEALRMIERNEIEDAKSIIGIVFYPIYIQLLE